MKVKNYTKHCNVIALPPSVRSVIWQTSLMHTNIAVMRVQRTRVWRPASHTARTVQKNEIVLTPGGSQVTGQSNVMCGA
jgi:hypothetical protein